MNPTTPKPGLYPGLSWSDYDRLDAINASVLKLFERSPAHAFEEMTHPTEPSDAMILGQATHAAILEPDTFHDFYAPPPAPGRRSKRDQDAWKAFEQEHPNITCLKKSDYDLCLLLREAVHSHSVAGEILSAEGPREISMVWKDESTGVLCKGRLDALVRYAERSTIVDVKTTRDASRFAFARQAANLRYHESAAFYLDGANALSPRNRSFLVIAAEKEPPYCVVVYEMEPEAIEQGRIDYRRHLEAYSRARDLDLWEGYSDSVELLRLPGWLYRNEEIE